MLLQIITVLFSIACAWLNSVPVRGMIRYGAKNWESSEFHQANAVVKLYWAIGFAYFLHLQWLMLLILLLIQWLVFDIALNLFIGKHWDYLGTTSKLDRLVKNGSIKAIVLVVIIIVLNLILRKI